MVKWDVLKLKTQLAKVWFSASTKCGKPVATGTLPVTHPISQGPKSQVIHNFLPHLICLKENNQIDTYFIYSSTYLYTVIYCKSKLITQDCRQSHLSGRFVLPWLIFFAEKLPCSDPPVPLSSPASKTFWGHHTHAPRKEWKCPPRGS